MIKKIKIFGLFVLISGGSLFAQVDTTIQPPVKEVLVPETITIKKEQSKELQMKKEALIKAEIDNSLLKENVEYPVNTMMYKYFNNLRGILKIRFFEADKILKP